MVFVAQVKVSVGASVTVNVALQVVDAGGQLLVTVQVTVVVPPHLLGPSVPPLLLIAPSQPPVNVAVNNHALYAASTAA